MPPTKARSDLNIIDPLSDFARRNGERAALVVGPRAISYAQMDRLVWRVCAWLSRHGIGAGTSVALCIEHPATHVIAACALARMGAAHYGFAADQLNEATLSIVRQARASVLLTDRPDLAVASLPTLRITTDSDMEDGPLGADSLRSADPDLVCLFASSSGTTGKPKFMTMSHRVMFARAGHSGPLRFKAGDRFLSLLDVSVFMQKALCLIALMSGATIYFPVVATADELIKYCNEHAITNIVALPAMVPKLMPARPGTTLLPHLKYFVMAGSTVTPQIFEAVSNTLSPNVFVAYGTNELSTVSYASPEIRRRLPAAIGRCIEGVEWQIVDRAGNLVRAGEIGELRVRTLCMIDCYPGQPELNRHHFRDGWFCPGDLVSATEDDILLFHGRADDMMIFDSLNIYPAEIETALLAHPAVVEAAAFPLASAVYQDVPAAAVALKSTVSEAELLAHCRGKLGPRSPQRILVVGRLPRNAMGKVVKEELVRKLAMPTEP